MADFVSITVAIVIIFMVFRWLSGDASQPARQGQTRRVPPARPVSPEMIDTVKAMFPHIPVAAIQYDLQKTGSVELTCENVLRDGTLPMPPSSRPSTPSSASGSTIGRNAGVGSSTGAAGSSSTATASGSSTSQNVNLLHRYGLSDHAARNYVPEEPTKEWADTAEKRQQIFKSRKEFMILQARKKLLEEEERKKQEEEEKAKNAAAATAASSESIQA